MAMTNAQHLAEADKLISQMIELERIYRVGKVKGPVDYEYDLTPQQTEELIESLIEAKTRCQEHLNLLKR